MFPKNKSAYFKRFKSQLTEWCTLEMVKKLSETFYKYDGKGAYGKTFFVKCYRGEYAIFTSGELRVLSS